MKSESISDELNLSALRHIKGLFLLKNVKIIKNVSDGAVFFSIVGLYK